ncbi:MAG: efflux RND transporter periplasmic adaptor subunit [bacterium]|nr:efflux RND transporter periplasmic adaptor subunit [bacterium]
MIRKFILYILLIVFFFGAYVAMSVIPNDEAKPAETVEAPPAPLREVMVMTVEPEPFNETISVPGVIEAAVDVTLGAAIPGIVERVMVKEGDFVREGQELFEIDLRSRQALLNDAQAALDLAVRTLERKKTLRDRGDISTQDYDEAVTAEQRARASVNRFQVEVSLGKVTAPASGLIDSVPVEEGEYMREGGELARLLQLESVDAAVGVPERYADAVSQEKTARVLIEALNETHEAQVRRVAYGGDARTNTFEALLRMSNPDLRIRPGMIVRAELIVKRVPNALLVPLAALAKRKNGMVVYVEKNGKVESRLVSMGAVEGDRVEILDGVAPDDRVVVIGQQELVDGEAVRVVNVISRDEAAEMIQKSLPQT